MQKNQPRVFATTHWSMIAEAVDTSSPQCSAALEELCTAYWYPLYAYARRCGENADDARDLTQGFFAEMLGKNTLGAADRTRGKFRWFLLASFKHYLGHQWQRAKAQKRGGGKQPVALDALNAEERYRLEPSHDLTADVLYERRWALTLLERARDLVGNEWHAKGKGQRFTLLEQYLPGKEPEQSHAEVAAALNSSDGAIKVEVHRMKKRYGEVLRDEVAKTVADPNEVDNEIQHLIDALFRK